MMETINAQMEGTGVSCKLQRRSGGDVYRDVTDRDMLEADMSMRCRSVAEGVHKLPRAARMRWAIEERRRGNELFDAGEFREALLVYMQSLMGLDYGSDAEQRRRAVAEHQIPVTNNMAVCCLKTGDLQKCIRLCDQTLKADPGNFKAMYRRGLANLRGQNWREARDDLRDALAMAEQPGERGTCRKLLREAAEGLKSQRGRDRKAREGIQKLLGARGGGDGGLYADKGGSPKRGAAGVQTAKELAASLELTQGNRSAAPAPGQGRGASRAAPAPPASYGLSPAQRRLAPVLMMGIFGIIFSGAVRLIFA